MVKLIRACVNILPKPLRELYYKYEEKWLYLFFGLLTTAVSFVSAGIAKVFLENADMGNFIVSTVSTVFSWICAVTFAYVTNRLWVFESHASGASEIAKEAASFYGGRVFTLIVAAVVMGIGNGLCKFNYWIMKITASAVELILNYIISKLLVFRNGREAETDK